MGKSSVLPLLVLFSLISSSMAEIKTLKITDDTRPLILFEKFGFTASGFVDIFVSDVSVTSSLGSAEPLLFGFFLLSDESLIQATYESQQRQQQQQQQQQQNPDSNPNFNPNCFLSSPYVRPLFKFNQLVAPSNSFYNNSFKIIHPDEYSLYFANCNPESRVSMAVRTVVYNALPDGTPDYLSVGQSPVPSLYFFFALAYVAFLVVWIYFCLVKNRASSHRIHHLMAGLLLTKALNLVFAAEDQHYVRVTGTPHGWDVLFYIFQFLKGVLLFTVIVLIGTGWSLLKPYLQDRDKKVLMVVIPLQVVANIAQVAIDESGPYARDWVTWKQVFLLVDVVCCCAILFPIVWSIKNLREAARTDGKAAVNLMKLTLFRQYYVVVICYIYFTRVVVYALVTITSYRYLWTSIVAGELATLAFYIFTGYKFRPEVHNPYFVIDDEEEEAAAEALKLDDEFEL